MVCLKLPLHRRRGDPDLIEKPRFECIMMKKYWYLTLNKLANRLVIKIFDFLPRDSFLYILFLRDISMEVGHFKKGACFLVLLKSLLISHWEFLISHCLWCGYCWVSFECFILRDSIIALIRNKKKLQKYSTHSDLAITSWYVPSYLLFYCFSVSLVNLSDTDSTSR